ncbi:MAG TPA: hypothetical protein HPQ00_16845 [Magnetococcales bacterium]|nr:hypothetical protein [Magnetococcales bacterium]
MLSLTFAIRLDAQQAAWCKAIEVFQEGKVMPKQLALFPKHRTAPVAECQVVQIRLNEIQIRRAR